MYIHRADSRLRSPNNLARNDSQPAQHVGGAFVGHANILIENGQKSVIDISDKPILVSYTWGTCRLVVARGGTGTTAARRNAPKHNLPPTTCCAPLAPPQRLQRRCPASAAASR